MPRILLKWLARVLKALLLLVVIGIPLLFLTLWIEHKTTLTLPATTGRFAVGRTTYVWTNNAQTDELAPSPDTKRELFVWIWYPSAANSPAPPAEYLPAAWRDASKQYSGILLSDFLTRDLAKVRVHSKADPEIAPDLPKYPVVIMRTGAGALTVDYTVLAEDLASHGYVVVGFDAPYRTSFVVLPDRGLIKRPPAANFENYNDADARRLAEQLLPMWTGDVAFVVSELQALRTKDPTGRFRGRLDLDRLGIFGHSFGGAQALQFCHDNAICKAGIDIDGIPFGSAVQEGVKQPFMFILSDHSREISDPASREVMSEIQSIHDRLPDGGPLIKIRGANHFTFSDQILLKSQFLIAGLRITGIFGNLKGPRGLAITTDYVHTFFDVYLNGVPASQLASLASKYPEVEISGR